MGLPYIDLSITPKVMFITHTLLEPLEGLITMRVVERIRRRNPFSNLPEWTRLISRDVVVVTVILIIASPISGIVLLEPLKSEECIEYLAKDIEPIIAVVYWTTFKGYAIHGLPEWFSYMISVALGHVIIIATYYSVLRFTKARLA